jgi:hypothetical protein
MSNRSGVAVSRSLLRADPRTVPTQHELERRLRGQPFFAVAFCPAAVSAIF